jgi:hypothetical protein
MIKHPCSQKNKRKQKTGSAVVPNEEKLKEEQSRSMRSTLKCIITGRIQNALHSYFRPYH